MAAGLKNLELISKAGFYEDLSAKVSTLLERLKQAAKAANIGLTTNQVGGMFGLFFTDVKKVTNLKESSACDQELFKKFFHGMLDRGVYLAPSAFEAGFVSAAHTDEDIQQTIDTAANVFQSLN